MHKLFITNSNFVILNFFSSISWTDYQFQEEEKNENK
jgi:hypothetical protein